MRAILRRIATRRNLLRWSVLLGAMLIAMNIASSVFFASTGGAGLLDFAGGANLLDNRAAGFSPAEARRLLAAYGAAGRRAHLILTLSGDVALPIALAGWSLVALAYRYRSLLERRWAAPLIALLPGAYLAADYGENGAIVAMLLRFPAAADTFAVIANAMLTVKFIASSLIVLLVLGGWAWAALRQGAARRPGASEGGAPNAQ